MAGALQTVPLGPFTRGVITTAEPGQNLIGAVQSLANFRFTGAGKLVVRDGTRVVLTLKDDATTPASITDVCAISPFTDGCLIVGHSSVTEKAYLYRLNATLDTWTDDSGTTHANATPEPVGVLWEGIPDPPEVMIAEGLGVGYIAHTAAADSSALAFPLKSFDDSDQSIATVTSDLDSDSTPEDLYALGCVSFQQHLWIWGVGSGTTVTDAYRPELARFSEPNFDDSSDLFAPSDSLTLGNRVRSLREGIVGGFVAGDALFLGAPYLVSRITGYGRSSWFKQPLDNSYGFVNQKCAVAVGGTLYYWSPRGPMRVSASGGADGLFDAIQSTVEQVVNVQTVVASFDSDTDCVIFAFDLGDGVRSWAGFDVRREVWVGPANDWGLSVRAMAAVTPIYQPTAAATLGPTAAPTSASTTSVGGTTAKANWTAGDLTSPSVVRYRVQGTTTWTTAGTVGAGIQSFTFTGLANTTDYEWDVFHRKDGIDSTHLGPTTDTQFTTLTLDDNLLPPTGVSLSFSGVTNTLTAYWTNSGESGVSTDVELAPSPGTSYVLQQQASPGQSSASMEITATDTYYVRLRHTKSGASPSSYTTPVSQFCSVF